VGEMMPDLDFQIEGAEVLKFAAAPSLLFKLRIDSFDDKPVTSITLSTQIRIVPRYRAYSDGEEQQLIEVFGESRRWAQTLNSLLWTHTVLQIPGFTGSTVVDMPVPCTYDFDVVSAKYFHALEGGEVPLEFLFSGTLFYAGDNGLQVGRIPWDKEAAFRLPVHLWHEMMEHYFPNTAWLRLRKDAFNRLYDYKSRHGHSTWEAALETLLDMAGEEVEGQWTR
jgi:hypothetical protein